MVERACPWRAQQITREARLWADPKFTNTPQAKDDEFAFTEDNLTIVYLTVTANDDLGGNAKGLWSVDNGVNDTGA